MKQNKLADFNDPQSENKYKVIKNLFQFALTSFILSFIITIIKSKIVGFENFFYVPLIIALLTIAIGIKYSSMQKERDQQDNYTNRRRKNNNFRTS